jgi:ubiquinone/menaquinone biosynthesis C-methylase UbiE
MHNLVFKNKTFDLVVAGWVIAYSSDPIKAIIEFHRVLKPNGMAIITWELPMQYKIGGFKDFSLVRKKTTDDDYKIFPPLSIFNLLVKTFQIQSFTCESLQPNLSPGLMTLVLRKIT